MDIFIANSTEMDFECLGQDFDDVDLYCTKIQEEPDDECDVMFE